MKRWGTWAVVLLGLAMLAGGLHECIRDVPFESGGEEMPGAGAYEEIGTRLLGVVLIVFGALVSAVALAFAVQSEEPASGPHPSGGGEEGTQTTRLEAPAPPPGTRRATPVTLDSEDEDTGGASEAATGGADPERGV